MKDIIWSYDFTAQEWDQIAKELFEDGYFPGYEYFEDVPEDRLYEKAAEINDMYFEDLVEDFNIRTKNPIVAIARLDLWNCRPIAYQLVGTNLKNIFRTDYEPTWYFDGEDIKCDEVHHDGTNHIVYRELGENEEDNDFFLDLVYNQKVTDADIAHFTRPIGSYVQ